MQVRPFADELLEDMERDNVLCPDRAMSWLNEETEKAGQMPNDFYIQNITRHFLYDLGKTELLLLLFCIEAELPYRDYLSFADRVEWMFTEDHEVLGKRMAVHYKVKCSLRGFISNKFCFC